MKKTALLLLLAFPLPGHAFSKCEIDGKIVYKRICTDDKTRVPLSGNGTASVLASDKESREQQQRDYLFEQQKRLMELKGHGQMERSIESMEREKKNTLERIQMNGVGKHEQQCPTCERE